jgi:hypothetical protein
LGNSGAGKSTLAGDFYRAGHPVISDDCLRIREEEHEILGVPSYGGLRLWGDSLETLFKEATETQPVAGYSSKRRITLMSSDIASSNNGTPILALIVLSPKNACMASEIHLEPLSRRDAFIDLHRQSFQLDPSDLERMTRHMKALGRIVPRLKVFQLSLPHDYSLLPLVRQKILEAVT